MKTFGFPKKFRLRKKREFSEVYEEKKILRDGILKIYYRPNGLLDSRVGLSVGKKNGKAVQRNRIKRLFREAFRLNRPDLPRGYDLVMIPNFRRGEIPPLEKILESLLTLMKKIK